jgi:hypothetical protein
MSGTGGDIGARIESLDVSLFDAVLSQSFVGDRRALLAVQRSVRREHEYVYLEIGSYLGGSIQQHLVDPCCREIISIDKRTLSPPDDRGEDFAYEGNSTARMMDNLRRVSAAQLGKIRCFDADAGDIDPSSIPAADFCFIDGEHTAAAVRTDFAFCLRTCTPNAAICFHDDFVIAPALRRILSDLRRQGVPFTARKLTGRTFGIFLRNCPALRDSYLSATSRAAGAWLLPRLLRRRLRSWVPTPLLPVARSVAGWFRAGP